MRRPQTCLTSVLNDRSIFQTQLSFRTSRLKSNENRLFEFNLRSADELSVDPYSLITFCVSKSRRKSIFYRETINLYQSNGIRNWNLKRRKRNKSNTRTSLMSPLHALVVWFILHNSAKWTGQNALPTCYLARFAPIIYDIYLLFTTKGTHVTGSFHPSIHR